MKRCIIILSVFLLTNCGGRQNGNLPDIGSGIWTSTAGPSAAHIQAFAVAPDKVYAGTSGGVFYNDKGTGEWKLLADNRGIVELLPGKTFKTLLYHLKFRRLYATLAESETAYIISIGDQDAAWRVEEDVPNGKHLLIASSDDKVYALIYNSAYQTENGDDWTLVCKIDSPLISPEAPYNKSPISFTVDPSKEIHYIGTWEGVISVNEHGEATALNDSQDSVSFTALHYDSKNGVLYGFNANYGLYLSKPGDDNAWLLLTDREQTPATWWVTAFAVDADFGTPFIAVIDDNLKTCVYKKTVNWEIVSCDEDFSSHIPYLAVEGDTIYAGTENGVFVSDPDSQWQLLANNNGLSNTTVTVLEYDSNSDNLLAQTTEVFGYVEEYPDVVATYYGIYSINNAGQWELTEREDYLESSQDRAVIDSFQSNFNYSVSSAIVIPGSDVSVVATSDKGIYMRQGSGEWMSFNEGLPNLAIRSMAYDSKRGVLYAGTDGNGVWKRVIQ